MRYVFSAVKYLEAQSKWHKKKFGKLGAHLLHECAIKNDGKEIEVRYQSNHPRFYCGERQVSQDWISYPEDWVPYAE